MNLENVKDQIVNSASREEALIKLLNIGKKNGHLNYEDVMEVTSQLQMNESEIDVFFRNLEKE